MEQIAVIVENTYLYWSSVILMLAAGAAVCCFWALYPAQSGNVLAAAVYVPLALTGSLVLARLAHWYFRPEIYGTLEEALDPGRGGGFALPGVFGGCLLAAALVRLMGLTKNGLELLDCVSLSGCLGIALGRLSFWFNTADRGMQLTGGAWFPWVSAMVNPVSGAEEFRLSVFLLQAVAAGMLFLVLLIWYLAGGNRRRDGDAALIFLLCYGASQVLLDSMRYDSLHFRSNGFVSAVQVMGAAAILLAAVVFAAVLISVTGWKKWYLILWLLQGACFGTAAYMEYYVQRHGDAAVAAYSIMGAALAGLVGLTLWTRCLAAGKDRGSRNGEASEKTDQIPE